MRNLKKLLALVLAMVMAFSLMLSASAASGDFDKYGDKDEITDTFKEAVQVLSGLDVLKGDGPDDAKTFRPADTLTRAEAAVIVYRVATGDVTDNQTALYADYNHFADVSKDDWFAGYVGFCQNGGYIKGTTPTTFSPYLKVTGYELLAMLLRVVGYGKNNEFVGSSWQVNTAALAESLHVTDTVKEANFSSTLNMAARRDVVAELTFQTMTIVPTVTYSSSLQYSDRDSVLGGSAYKNPTLGQKIFGLFMDDTAAKIDEWGCPPG